MGGNYRYLCRLLEKVPRRGPRLAFRGTLERVGDGVAGLLVDGVANKGAAPRRLGVGA